VKWGLVENYTLLLYSNARMQIYYTDGEKRYNVINKQVSRRIDHSRMRRRNLSSAVSITNGYEVDQGSGSSGDRGSIGGMEWSVITPLIRLYTASGYCLDLIRFSRDSAASTFPTPSSARTMTSHVDGSR